MDSPWIIKMRTLLDHYLACTDPVEKDAYREQMAQMIKRLGQSGRWVDSRVRQSGDTA
jgi:hypothetical protein